MNLMEKDISKQKKADMDIFLSDKIYFKPEKITSQNGQYIKESIHQEDITLVNIYAPI